MPETSQPLKLLLHQALRGFNYGIT